MLRRRKIENFLACILAMLLMVSCSQIDINTEQKSPTAPANEALSQIHLQPVDGGVDFYGRFENPLPSDTSYFPIGVWLQSIIDMPLIDKDLAIGINTYVGVTDESNPAQLDGKNAYFLAPWPYEGSRGYVVSDEVDMWAGAGNQPWTGKMPAEGVICEPENSGCGYTVQRKLSDRADPSGIMRYANYGKGVTFWQYDEEAAHFVNDYQDVVSADNYWYTDPNICSAGEGGQKLSEPRDLTDQECRLAANYGWTVERIRSLIAPAGSKPVWAFVEVGHPSTDSAAPSIKPEQIRAAVWHSIIKGARGIIYFNHSFAGPCYSHQVLRECDPKVATAVGEINHQITELAPVLNADTVVNGASSEDEIELVTKLDGDSHLVIAGSRQHDPQSARITLTCASEGTAEVVGENRDVPIVGSTLEDKFDDGEAVHIYRYTAGNCGS